MANSAHARTESMTLSLKRFTISEHEGEIQPNPNHEPNILGAKPTFHKAMSIVIDPSVF